MHLAALSGSAAAVRALLAAGASVSVLDDDGKTPWQLAAERFESAGVDDELRSLLVV